MHRYSDKPGRTSARVAESHHQIDLEDDTVYQTIEKNDKKKDAKTKGSGKKGGVKPKTKVGSSNVDFGASEI